MRRSVFSTCRGCAASSPNRASPIAPAKRYTRGHDHQNRYWRLDLRAVARDLLSGEMAAEARARLCRRARHRDRDQRHLLWQPEAGDVRVLGEGGAGRVRVLAQGVALLHQPEGAGRGGRVDREVHRAGDRRARRPARTDPVAVHGDQEIRRGRLRGVPEAVAGQAGRARAAPRGAGPAREFRGAGVRRDVPRCRRRNRLRAVD